MSRACYAELLKLLREAATFSSVAELLAWDQETTMPPRAGAFRAEAKGLISATAHRRATDPRVGELIAACEADAEISGDPLAAANLREIRRDHDRAVRLPVELIAEISETDSRALEAWRAAREASDYALFLPWMEKQIALNRRKAECWGAPEGGDLYDALLEDFEPGTTGAELASVFGPLRAALTPLVEALAASPHGPSREPFRVAVPVGKQKRFNRELLRHLGFDTRAGRMDVSTHPFSTSLGPADTRITSRYTRDGFLDSLGTTLHETGHALYEQGLPKEEHFGLPLGQPMGLGIHESQSRLWENHVGRSRAFCEWVLPRLQRAFGSALRSRTVDELYGAVNEVRPNLIRVESDEATYHAHIVLRFDLERAMILDHLRPADLPAAWNERVRRDLGLDVPNDRVGCMQDVHWSMGAFGYFPTYTLGSLYAAQLWEALRGAVPDVDARLARGEFDAVLDWLRENVHAHGRRWPARELCRRVTGGALSHEPLMRHLEGKLRPLYRIDVPARK
jgi:carboxypeptidase Taq